MGLYENEREKSTLTPRIKSVKEYFLAFIALHQQKYS